MSTFFAFCSSASRRGGLASDSMSAGSASIAPNASAASSSGICASAVGLGAEPPVRPPSMSLKVSLIERPLLGACFWGVVFGRAGPAGAMGGGGGAALPIRPSSSASELKHSGR